jgi:hypothetical protein
MNGNAEEPLGAVLTCRDISSLEAQAQAKIVLVINDGFGKLGIG